MALDKIADQAVKRLQRTFRSYDISEEQLDELTATIASAMEETVETASRAHRDAAIACCGPEADLAHQINHEASLETQRLIQSLNQMR